MPHDTISCGTDVLTTLITRAIDLTFTFIGVGASTVPSQTGYTFPLPILFYASVCSAYVHPLDGANILVLVYCSFHLPEFKFTF